MFMFMFMLMMIVVIVVMIATILNVVDLSVIDYCFIFLSVVGSMIDVMYFIIIYYDRLMSSVRYLCFMFIFVAANSTGLTIFAIFAIIAIIAIVVIVIVFLMVMVVIVIGVDFILFINDYDDVYHELVWMYAMDYQYVDFIQYYDELYD